MVSDLPPTPLDFIHRERLAKVLARFPVVQWDRFFCNRADGLDFLTAFGWIKREKDAYMDFVVIGIDFRTARITLIATSSAEHSHELALVFGSEIHVPCQRVEDYTRIENCVKLNPAGKLPTQSL